MFVTADGEGPERRIFRKAQNNIKCENGKKKNKKYIKISDNHIYIYI